MTPQREEAALCQLTPDAVQYRYHDDAPELLAPAHALTLVAAVLAWCGTRVQQAP